MSDDLIKREDAMQVAFLYPFFSDALMEEINAIPSADRPQGEWTKAYDGIGGRVKCTNCFKTYDWDSEAQYYNYCPNCGARMKGADDGKGVQSADE